ncbi:uncharacterized protein K441DRAFT_61111 [Cenococcum geophilum 1.58]|uniref:uncharacterized protein n=1 Tax=Cenococcum geophilum 1.58 TaxID=794803 RepID=UPI00358F42E4|nr:hypothetical protein K441DRAFT_61111 [Cenococcum geophilum 1.58]
MTMITVTLRKVHHLECTLYSVMPSPITQSTNTPHFLANLGDHLSQIMSEWLVLHYSILTLFTRAREKRVCMYERALNIFFKGKAAGSALGGMHGSFSRYHKSPSPCEEPESSCMDRNAENYSTSLGREGAYFVVPTADLVLIKSILAIVVIHRYANVCTYRAGNCSA